MTRTSAVEARARLLPQRPLLAQEPGLFRWIVDELLNRGDRFFHLADLPQYIADQRTGGPRLPGPGANWRKMSILKRRASAKFSSDRTIREYASRDLETALAIKVNRGHSAPKDPKRVFPVCHSGPFGPRNPMKMASDRVPYPFAAAKGGAFAVRATAAFSTLRQAAFGRVSAQT